MPERLTDERLEELMRLCAEATPGPWRWHKSDDPRVDWALCRYYDDDPDPFGYSIFEGSPVLENEAENHANADLMAAARDALPALIAEVRALRRVAEAAEACLPYLPQPTVVKTKIDHIEVATSLRTALAEWRRVREGSSDDRA